MLHCSFYFNASNRVAWLRQFEVTLTAKTYALNLQVHDADTLFTKESHRIDLTYLAEARKT